MESGSVGAADVFVPFAETVEGIPVPPGLRRRFLGDRQRTQCHSQETAQSFKFRLGRIVLSGNKRHGYRIDEIGAERPLVDIQSDTDDAGPDETVLQGVLDKHPADLPVADIDVVRPLDEGTDAAALQIFPHSERCGAGDAEGFGGGEWESRLEDERERQVLTGSRMPAVAPLSASGRLFPGSQN